MKAHSEVPAGHTEPSDGNPSNLPTFQPLNFLLVLVAGFRLGALLLLRPGGFIYDFSDYTFYRLTAQFTNQGAYPVLDFWMEYPPLFPWLNSLLYRLSLLLPPAYDPRLWHYLLLGLVLLPFDLGILVLLHRIADRTWSRRVAVWCAAVQIGTPPQPNFVQATASGRFGTGRSEMTATAPLPATSVTSW